VRFGKTFDFTHADLQEKISHDSEKERQMPYVTSIEGLAKMEGYKEGYGEGFAIGYKEGFAEGARSALLWMIRTYMKDKFGSAPLLVMAKVRSIKELPLLRALARELASAKSLDTFHDLLEQREQKTMPDTPEQARYPER
jgi:hypothetical protein